MNSSIFVHKGFRRIALASVVALGAFGAANGFAASATSNSTATVIAPITITKGPNLSFGKFAPGTTAGTVTVNTDNSRTNNGSSVILSNSGSTGAAGTFLVEGEADATYTIGWSGDIELIDTVTTTNPAMALARHSATTQGTATTEVGSGTLTSGSQTIYLGGTLTVGASQPAGTYTGDVVVTVEYN